jgi:phosphoesterase RecJ-like protein
MEYGEFASLLMERDNFLILSHVRPDGDTLGSGAALCSALRRAGKTAYTYNNPEITEKYLPYVSAYFAPDGFAPDCTVAVDTAEPGLFPKYYSGRPDMCVDHHPSNTGYAPVLLLRDRKSACGEIILELVKLLNGNISREEAALLYIAISTDTGCFQYSNTNAETLRAAAETLDAGANVHELNQRFFRRVTRARIELEGMIYSGMTFHHGGYVAVAEVTLDMLQKAGATENDCDDLASLVGRVEGAEVGVTIREMEDGRSKISVRSSPNFDSSALCAVFGGGGHKMASGCTIKCQPDEAKLRLLQAIDGMLK